MPFEELRSELAKLRIERDLRARDARLRIDHARRLERHLRELERIGDAGEKERAAIERERASLEVSIAEARKDARSAHRAAAEALARLATLETPRAQLRQLSERFPMFLLPLRLEYRYRLRSAGHSRDELWLRAYPDILSVETHEPELTENEIELAERYWREHANAGGDRDGQLGAWRLLSRAVGPTRAAWVAHSHRPERLDSSEGVLTFPSRTPREGMFTEPARARTLPERLVVLGHRGGSTVFEHVGAVIPDVLPVGPTPIPDDPADRFRVDEDGRLEVDAGMRWMGDFDEAVRVGMGFRIPLDETTAREGLDRLLVVGVRTSFSPEEGSHALETLLEDHHYSHEGLSILPQGTATNNTGDAPSGWSSASLPEDESFRIEMGEPLFTPSLDPRESSDGERLARALGIRPEVLAHVRFADGRDQRDARDMNAALWPATGGAFLEEMLHPSLSETAREWTRAFFVDHVSGRGPIPALRARRQPYGILVTTAFSAYRPMQDSRESELLRVIGVLENRFRHLLPRVAFAGKPGDAQAHLLDILGLHATSAEYHQRFAASTEMLENLVRFYGESALNVRSLFDAAFSGVLEELGAPPGATLEIMKKIFYRSHTLLDGPFIDVGPLSEEDPVRGTTPDGWNYLAWLARSPVDAVRRQDFGAIEGETIAPPRALLYLLLRHAVLEAWCDAGYRLHASAGLLHERFLESTHLYIDGRSPGKSKLELLYTPAGALADAHRELLPDRRLSLAEQLPGVRMERPELARLRDLLSVIERLSDVPTARLARAFAEHLDLMSYRLDAWKLGLASRRLDELRHASPRGVHLGAYGWLEPVRPNHARRPYEGMIPPALQRDALEPITMASDSAGYVHAPSLAQAATAAVLRNGTLSHASAESRELASMKLTSDRVRNALRLLEGVKNGQPLGALLGYAFERGLAERYREAEVQAYVHPLRKKFPLVGDRLNPTADDVPIERVEARHVIDGLAMIRHVQSTGSRSYPFGLSELPTATSAQRAVIDEEVARLERHLDALGDLLLAEGVHQIVRGNTDRAVAALDALGTGEALPDPEVVRTPRSGRHLTHRVALHLVPRAPFDPYGGRIAITPRAEAEPALNGWMSERLPDPDRVAVRIVELDADGQERAAHEVRWTALGLQAIDLVYLLPERLEHGKGELDERIAFTARRQAGIDDAIPLRIEYTAAIEGKLGFFEIAPLVRALRRAVLEARPLSAEDLRLPAEDGIPDSEGFDGDEIAARVSRTEEAIDRLARNLEEARVRLGAEASSPSDLESIRELLLAACGFGVDGAVPASAREGSEAAIAALDDQVQGVVGRLHARLAAARAIPRPPDDARASDRAHVWVEIGRTLFEDRLRFLPLFALDDEGELANAYGARETLLRDARLAHSMPVEEWLEGVARVRPSMRALEEIDLLAPIASASGFELTPLQLPFRPDDRWLGLDVPDGYELDGDRLLLSLVIASDARFEVSARHAGLLLDEWVETIPEPNETTGLAFHYDAPSSEPPQACLLVVSPTLDGEGHRFEHLVSALHETLDLAKLRAIEPDQLADSPLAQLLPAVMLPATRHMITLSTLLSANITGFFSNVDFGAEDSP